MKSKQRGYTLTELMVVLTTELMVVLTIMIVVISWTVNAVRLVSCDFEAPYKAEVLHTIGLIPIIAPITVWVDDSPPEAEQ